MNETTNNQNSKFEILSLVFGIISILTGCFCIGGLFGIAGIVFFILSNKDIGTTKKNTAGLVTSIIGIILTLLIIIIAIITPSSNNTIDSTTETTTEAISAENTTETITTEDTTTESTESANASTEYHIYNTAVVKPVMNGFRTEKIGEYSIIKIPSSNVTIEDLTDWYFNYVEQNDFNYCVILYSDKDDCSGVYSIKGLVETDVIFTEDEYGDYSLSEADATANSTVYAPNENGTLTEITFEN